MLPAAAAPTSRTVATPERPLDQPSAYSPIPQRLIADLHDSPLAIGLYGLIARLYLVAQSPIPLSAPDVLRYDPALSRGAVLRALARLLAAGYLIESTQTGCKTRYTPAWGRIGGSPLAWNMARPCLGRPRHIASLRLDRRLLDICMGKLTPHATRAAVITRYVTAPILSLTDVGCYALTMAGLPRATPALVRLGAVREGHVQPLPSDQRLLALISQRALDLDQHPDVCVELTSSGTRRMGLQPLLAPDSAASTTQPLFFVPPHMIGMLIHPVIGPMIGSDASAVSQTTAAVSDESGRDTNREGITWESRDLPDEATPPPTPPYAQGGGAGTAYQSESSAEPRSNLVPLPDTESAALLRTINVKPAQIAELAHMPLASVEGAIADGRSRPAVRDLAGWVVSLLRTHRDYGWKIAPPAPAPDSAEALREAFARYAAERDVAREAEPGDRELLVDQDTPSHVSCLTSAPELSSLVRLWNEVQAAMATRITRHEFRTWIEPAVLRSVEQGVATISVPSARIKDGLEQRYTVPLGEEFTTTLGTPIQLHVTIHGAAPVAHAQPEAPRTSLPGPRSPTLASPPVEPDRRPDWVCAERWVVLPRMLRAALIGSTLGDSAIQALSPHLQRLIECRYPREAAALIAAAKDDAARTDEGRCRT